MAEAARIRDVLDIRPLLTDDDLARLNQRFAGADTAGVIQSVFDENLLGNTAVVSSFGAESAILLHLIAAIERNVPILFLDTGKHFPETLLYRDTLVSQLGLTAVINLTPNPEQLQTSDTTGLRWSYDPDGCCAIRKVLPLERALSGLDSTITGRKVFQSKTRNGLALFERDNDRIKFNPLAGWSKQSLDAYIAMHELPPHPLVSMGYPSIGCAPCTSMVLPGEDPRSGRWRGWEKVECGIHTPVTMLGDPSIEPVF